MKVLSANAALLVYFVLMAVSACPCSAHGPESARPTTLAVSYAAEIADGGGDDASDAAPEWPQLERIVLVFKTHFDIGYTDMAANVVKQYRTSMIDDALDVCDRTDDLPAEQRFIWTVPGWPMKTILDDWPGQTAERRERVMRAFRSGRFVTHALPFSTHTDLLEIEDLVRGMQYSSQITRAAGLPLPLDAKMTDVPTQSWLLPTMLQHAGIQFLHIGSNPVAAPPDVPTLFWWEGPDGSRLLTMFSHDYGSTLLPPDDWPYKTWLALIHTGDNAGPPSAERVKGYVAEAKRRLPGVKIDIGRMSDFADAILAEQSDVPTVRGDMPDTWIHGPLADPAGAKMARNLRPAITTTETLAHLLRHWGLDLADNSPTIAAAFENSLLYGEHTWGGSFDWITKFAYGDDWLAERNAGHYERIESS